MAIRLSLDLEDATCEDLLRFTDTVRAAGTPPNQPIERAGPDRIEVSLERAPAGTDGPELDYGATGWLAGGPQPPAWQEPPGAPAEYSDPFGTPHAPGPARPPGPTGPPGHAGPGGPGRGAEPPGRPGPPPRHVGPMQRPDAPWYGVSRPYSGMPYPGMPISAVPGHFTAHFGPGAPLGGAPVSMGPPTQGGFISVRAEGVSHETQVSTETVEKWKAALSHALESGGLDETTRAPLLELREMLSVHRGFHPGSGS